MSQNTLTPITCYLTCSQRRTYITESQISKNSLMTISIKVVSFEILWILFCVLENIMKRGSREFTGWWWLWYKNRIKPLDSEEEDNQALSSSRTQRLGGGGCDKGGSQEKKVTLQKVRDAVFPAGLSGQVSPSRQEVKHSEDWERPAAFRDVEVVWKTAISVERQAWKPDCSGLRSEWEVGKWSQSVQIIILRTLAVKEKK